MADLPRTLETTPTALMTRLGGLFGLVMGVLFGGIGCFGGAMVGLPLGPCALLTGLIGALALGLGGGALSGLTYGGLMTAFFLAMKKPPRLVGWEEGEVVKVIGAGSRITGRGSSAPGTVHLTDRRVRFVPHDERGEDWSVPVRDVRDARAARSLGLLQNRWVLVLADGSEEVLLVESPEDWIAELAALQLGA